MAQITCIHGAQSPDIDTPATLARIWYPALSEGMELNGYRDTDFSLQCAWYADLLRDENTGNWPSLSADIRHAFNSLGGGSTVRSWLDSLLKTAAAQHLSDWIVQLFLAQAWRYLNDPLPRAEARMRVQQALAEDTRVVIAHSLGSVVAWESLMRNTQQVDTLITIGSPLAMPLVIANRLQPAPINNKLARPKLRRWVNISHIDDWIAHPSRLNAQVDGEVEDFILDHDDKPHEVESYLRSEALISAVVDALQLPLRSPSDE